MVRCNCRQRGNVIDVALATVVERAQPIERQRRPQEIAAELLEPLAVVLAHAHFGIEVPLVDACFATRDELHAEVVPRDRAAAVEQWLSSLPVSLDYRVVSCGEDLVIEGDDDASSTAATKPSRSQASSTSSSPHDGTGKPSASPRRRSVGTSARRSSSLRTRWPSRSWTSPRVPSSSCATLSSSPRGVALA